MTIRIAHFSDLHLTAKPLGWRPRDLLSKRVAGWMNVKLLGRGRRFRNAAQVTETLIHDLRSRRLDAWVFSGDATTMGFESEYAAAAHALAVDDDSIPGIAVPGNHDYYTVRTVRQGLFENYFAPWLHGIRLDAETYPFARQVGPLWLIGVNSATSNRWNWDASGEIGSAQLDRLQRLCAKLPTGPRIVVTHYPLRTARGRIEPAVHRLRDHQAALDCAKACDITMWLHGHIHRSFHLDPTSQIPFTVVCAGSVTQNNRWTYVEYAISEQSIQATWRTYQPQLNTFSDTGYFAVDVAKTIDMSFT